MWEVKYSKKFIKKLVELPDELRMKVERIVFEQLPFTDNPYALNFLNKMKGYKNKYKIRIGDYRIGLEIDKINKIIFVKIIAHRKDIYKIFP